MSKNVTINGQTYTLVITGETGWGDQTTALLEAIATQGLFSGTDRALTKEVDLGSTFGIKVKYVKSKSANAAAGGVLRLSNGDTISFRNAANGADIEVTIDSSNRLKVGGVEVATISSTDTLTNKTLTDASNHISASVIDSGTLPDARIASTGVTQHQGSIAHQSISGAGTNTHANIDSHISATNNPHTVTHAQLSDKGSNDHSAIDSHLSNTSNPHSVTKAQVGLTNVADVAQMPASYLDTDTALTANSDTKVPSQKAIKAYADTKAPSNTAVTLTGTQTLTNKNIDGGTASANNKLKLPEDTYANLVSLAGKTEGQIFYANDVDKVYYYNGTALIEVGSGSGTGKKNYILNPSAATDVSKWTASNFTATKDTSTAIPRETTTGTAFKLVSTNTAATFLSDAMLLDDTDLSKKLGVEIAINVADASNWTIDILASATAGGTYARLPLSTDVSAVTTLPATVGVFKTTVDMVAATPYIKFRITSAATAKTAYFSDILVTPDGTTVVGVAGEEWKTFTPTGTWVSNTTYTGKYRRVVDSIECLVQVQTSGAPTSTDLYLTLPNNLNIDTSKIVSTLGGQNNFGTVTIVDAGVENKRIGSITYNSSTQVRLNAGSGTSGSADAPVTATNPFTWAAGDTLWARFSVPIAEWAGSGTVNLAQNDEEYAFNTSTATTGSDTTSFGYGPTGVSFASVTASGRRRVRFQSPIQIGDRVALEVQATSTSPWIEVKGNDTNGLQTLTWQNGVAYGVGIDPTYINATDLDVFLGTYGYASGATYGANGTAWSGYTAYKWRVRKTSGGRAIGFSHVVPGVSAGLVPAAGLPGRTDGVAVGAGYVGEVKQVFNTSPISSSSDTWTYINVLTGITKGNWLIGYSVPISDPTGITGAFSRVVKVTQNADTGNVANSFIYAIDSVAGSRILSKQFIYTATADLASIELRFKTGGAGTMQAGPNATSTITEEDCQPVFYAFRMS